MVLASRKANFHDLMGSIRDSGIPRSHWEEFKPLFSREGSLSCQDKRVCLRVHAGAAWIPLVRLLEKLQFAHSKPCFGTRSQGTSKTLQRLESECTLLEIHEALGGVGGNPMVDLLLEGQYGSTQKEKWRAGKFFTEMVQLAWLHELKPGDRLDALDENNNEWQEACVDKITRNKVRVRYLGHESAFSGMLPLDSDAIAPPYSRVSDWRRVLKVGDLVQIGIKVKYSKTVRWREGQVTEISPGGDGVVKAEDGQDTRIHLLLDDDEMWVSVDDDMMCLPGTHELSPAPIKRERTETVMSLDDDEDDEQASDGGDVAKDTQKKRKRDPDAQKMQQAPPSTTQIAAQLKKVQALHKQEAAELLKLTDLFERSEQGQTERESSESDEDFGYEVYTKPAGL